ncbi:hypothetical protein [Sphingomonas sp. AX6]|uniref:hypothetical protein n=1 Tax=Sphingomonas sp. AX6 TaxID=2653171 RepID=UPI0012F0EF31|nr:hypothetical protein [Sphingomonas sp. AX6]VXC85701.1 conserved hypothetical protein [Sphingomonas sp. AX6]
MIGLILGLLMQTVSLEKPDPVATAPTADWLAGVWLLSADRTDLDRSACNSGTPLTYLADGTTSAWGESGRWSLVDDAPTETLIEVLPDTGDPDRLPMVGKQITQQLVRMGPDEGVLVDDAGARMQMLRCRAHDFAQ